MAALSRGDQDWYWVTGMNAWLTNDQTERLLGCKALVRYWEVGGEALASTLREGADPLSDEGDTEWGTGTSTSIKAGVRISETVTKQEEQGGLGLEGIVNVDEEIVGLPEEEAFALAVAISLEEPEEEWVYTPVAERMPPLNGQVGCCRMES